MGRDLVYFISQHKSQHILSTFLSTYGRWHMVGRRYISVNSVNEFQSSLLPRTLRPLLPEVTKHQFRLTSDSYPMCWCGHGVCFILPSSRNHHCPDNDYPQHHCPEVSPQGLLCHSDGSLCICLLHLRLLCFGGVWHSCIILSATGNQARTKDKRRKPCMYHFSLGPLTFLCRKITWFCFGLALFGLSVGYPHFWAPRWR